MIHKEYFLDKLSKNPTILDIGCFDCRDSMEFAEVFLQQGRQSYIHAFEPISKNFQKARTNLDYHNYYGDYNISLYNFALGDTNGPVFFYVSPDHPQSSSGKMPESHLYKFPAINFSDYETVNCRKLDDLVVEILPSNQAIDLVWADVNGFEEELISGGFCTFFNRVAYFYTEFSKNNLYGGQLCLEEIQEMLPDYELEYDEYFHKTGIGNALFKNKTVNL